MSADSSNKTPSQMGQYYLMEKIAQGGMAEIFKGLSYDVSGIKKTVCIKKILPHIAASNEFIDSLIDEAKIAVKLVHGNIAQTFDLGKISDDYFMVMEFVDGKSLSQIHKKCQLEGKLIPLQYLVYFISETLSGLDYIHRRTDDSGNPMHIVHRDMSPQNIMVAFSGTVKIIDFGIAKAGVKIGSTESGILKGKFAYMSPEQAYGDEIDHRSDIFSVGIMLHEMLTGRRLFKGSDSRETIRNVRKSKVEVPSLINNSVPEELDRICMKALAKDRRHRYEHASDMRDDLVKYLHTTFSDFKPSDAASFVQQLFQDDISGSQRSEIDSKTPYLIIDRANSAIASDSQFEVTGAARAPVDMGEYMVDEEGSIKSEKSDKSEKEDTGIHKEEETGEEKTAPRLPIPEETGASRSPRGIKTAAMAALVISALIVAAFIIVQKRSPQQTSEQTPVEDSIPAQTPAFGEILLVTDPSDAIVTLDGKEVGRSSPYTLRNLSAEKQYKLIVRKDGFVESARDITLEKGEFLSLNIKLEAKAPKFAELELVTEPAGATVFIDDKQTALKTPVNIPQISPKQEHTIGLFLKGYKFWTKKLDLAAGEKRSFHIALSVDYASLFVDSTPSDALIFIDGQPSGQTPLTKDEMSPKKIYKIEIWKEGYEPVTKEILLDAGKKTELRVPLMRSAVPPPAPEEQKIESPPEAKGTEVENVPEEKK